MFVGPILAPLPAYSGATFTSVQLVRYQWNRTKVLNSAKLSVGIWHHASIKRQLVAYKGLHRAIFPLSHPHIIPHNLLPPLNRISNQIWETWTAFEM